MNETPLAAFVMLQWKGKHRRQETKKVEPKENTQKSKNAKK